jgi:superfamily II DNA or RNA helicase
VIELRDYQIETVAKLENSPLNVTRSLCVMATGGGKTIVFAALLDRLLQPGQRGLVIAHREELLQQARDKIALAAPSLHVEIEQASSFASRTHPALSLTENRDRSVVVGSVQTMRGKRLEQWPRDAFRIVVIDEAHHATAESYIDLLTHFGCFNDTNATRLIGVTATPGRTDGIGLSAVFDEIAVSYGIRDLIKRGHLAEIRARQVQTETDLRDVKVFAGDYAQGQLEEAVNNERRNLAIVSAYERYGNGVQAIVFAAGVKHSHAIADIFNGRGIPARSIWGAMEKDARAEAIASYHAGQTRILTNFGVLTEGFDSPGTGCIILGRPTKSELLYTQMIGRGTRLHPGKDHLLVIDIADVASGKSLASVATLFGLPPKFNPQGGSVTRMSEEIQEVDPRLQHLATDRESLERIVAKTKAGLSVVEIDLFAALQAEDDDSLRGLTSFAWTKLADESYMIRVDKGFSYSVHCDTLGRYVVEWLEAKKTVVTGDKRAAFRLADRTIREKHADKTGLFDTRSHWRKQPATEKQKTLLATLLRGKALPENLSAGSASALLQSLFAARRGRRKTDAA